jgi:hypothetical protein
LTFTAPINRADAYDEYWRYSPRYIHGDVVEKMMRHEIDVNKDGGSPFMSIGEFLDATRRLKFYADLENVFPYEITNVYSYEFALRTKGVKRHLKQREGTDLDQMAYVPQGDDYWFDIDIVMKFERLRYDIHYLKTVGWKQKKWYDKSPKETFPKVEVPGSETEYAELKLNMYLPKDELVSYLEAYIENLEVAKHDNDEHKTLSKHVKSKIKIMKPKNNIPKSYHDIIGRLKRPRCLKAFKMAETFYAYDMVSMGFDLILITTATKK